MIEILLQAERALADGRIDHAERLYRQAADADPRNSIAVVGLARVALERDDEPEAWRQTRLALEIDPENVAAQRLAARLEEVWEDRGGSPPGVATAPAPPVALPIEPAPGPTTAPDRPSAAETGPRPPRERNALDRLLRRNRP